MSDRIEKSMDLKAPIEKVWRALADHEEFGQWFGVKLEGPFVPGKVTKGHFTMPDYSHLTWTATVQTMEPPTYFALTWHPYAIDPAIDYSHEPTTLIEFRLKQTADGTHLTITESGFDALPDHRRAEAFRMNDHGWTIQIGNIANHVAA
jgi:uncharacterized protein YndB with AHSA1/START domain